MYSVHRKVIASSARDLVATTSQVAIHIFWLGKKIANGRLIAPEQVRV